MLPYYGVLCSGPIWFYNYRQLLLPCRGRAGRNRHSLCFRRFRQKAASVCFAQIVFPSAFYAAGGPSSAALSPGTTQRSTLRSEIWLRVKYEAVKSASTAEAPIVEVHQVLLPCQTWEMLRDFPGIEVEGE